MVYSSNFVVAVKVGNKILREDGNSVQLPFGTEYSLLLKNLSSRKAVAEVSIDGQDVLNSRRIIVPANSSVELERFVENLYEGNRFKFIEKTDKISEHRGDRIDDGIVRVEYTFEREVIQQPIVNPIYVGPYYTYAYTCTNHRIGSRSICSDSVTYDSSVQSNSTVDCSCDDLLAKGFSSETVAVSCANMDGITVKGSESAQQFGIGNVSNLESQSHVITLKLQGYNSSKQLVVNPVTTKEKLSCPTCGTSNHSKNKYCSDCGTFLR